LSRHLWVARRQALKSFRCVPLLTPQYRITTTEKIMFYSRRSIGLIAALLGATRSHYTARTIERSVVRGTRNISEQRGVVSVFGQGLTRTCAAWHSWGKYMLGSSIVGYN
jgi:hypothetical protein